MKSTYFVLFSTAPKHPMILYSPSILILNSRNLKKKNPANLNKNSLPLKLIMLTC